MWYIHESTHQNEINIINFTKVLFNYVVDKKQIIFYSHNVPLAKKENVTEVLLLCPQQSKSM